MAEFLSVTSIPKDFIRHARARGFFTAESGSGHLIFAYKAIMRRAGLPSVCLIRHDRHCEISIVINQGCLTDDAKIDTAALLANAVLPFGWVVVTNRHVVCTKLSFRAAYDAARILAREVKKPANLIRGDMKSRRWARIEFSKRSNGRLRVTSGFQQFTEGRQAA